MRHVGRRLQPGAARRAQVLPRSVEQLTQLVGRMPLKDHGAARSTDLIEKPAASRQPCSSPSGNRASAAEMLGLSRQSLYVKLRRYGIADAGGD